MRPQRFSCGISSPNAMDDEFETGFNEAAAFQLRNPGAGLDDTRPYSVASMRPQRFSCGIR